MRKIGTVTKREWDSNGYERRERVSATCNCPTCGKPMDLIEQTVEWQRTNDPVRQWRHTDYDACPTGECCGRVVVLDGIGGRTMVFGPKNEPMESENP